MTTAPSPTPKLLPKQAGETIRGVTWRAQNGFWAIVAGLCIAASVPPWGWWPLAFVGIAIVDQLIATPSWRRRFARMWLVAAAWLYPAMLWMWDLTAPGYVAAGAFYAAYFGVAAALSPPRLRAWTLPGTFALAEFVRWSWPFGGVPLANVALGQVDSPFVYPARLGGPLLVVVTVVIVGQALARLVRHLAVARRTQGPDWAAVSRSIGPAVALTALFVLGGILHPRSTVERTAEVALVQGGGPQRTRASSSQEPVVLGRHVEASNAIVGPVDLIVWPENVVNPGRYLDFDDAYAEVVGVARRHDAPVLAGWFTRGDDLARFNYQSVIRPDGSETDRYDKVKIVPFGEYVPFRGLIESLAPSAGLPGGDLQSGTDPPVLDTDIGLVGVAISWEGYFEQRSRHSVREGAHVLTNPTNGSSYWLTQVQTQQVASNQLRAIENDRWVLQVAPTGLSAVIDPGGTVLQRTNVSERRTLQATVEMRSGRTLASVVGPWPIVAYGLLAAGAGVASGRRVGVGVRSPRHRPANTPFNHRPN